MGTRSRIAIENNETGKVRSVYCHWDGYPTGVGITLLKHYDTAAKVKKLIALGALSSLGANVAPPKGQKHSFEAPLPEVTVAYHRDRGEDLIADGVHADADALYAHSADGWEEWVYLFRQGVWFVTEVGGEAGPGLVTASDPDGSAPAKWQNLAGLLQFKPERKGKSYAFVGFEGLPLVTNAKIV